MEKRDMRPYQLQKIIDFCLNMIFAFFVVALAFGIIWIFYFICELQKYYLHMWKEGEIVTIGDKKYQIVKRKNETGTVCEECQAANKDAQSSLSWYERHNCVMSGTVCHCNMSHDCYPKLLD